MRKIILISITAVFIIGMMAIPSFAMSSLAEDFLRACRATDSEFPPPKWNKSDVRAAALEVLDAVDAGKYKDNWPLDFCIRALGYTEYNQDIDRILSYEQKMTYPVLIALRGFQHQKAVNLFLKYLVDTKSPKREAAVKGLAAVDFKKFDNPSDLKNKVLSALNSARQKEKRNWLKEEIDQAISIVKGYSIPTS
jgi:MoxR-like ATPase